ncbi:MAG: FAD-dependent monooxygenase [Saprospiraceae bacterium]
MKVIIIGGGIGGLTLANTLQKQGIDYEVYEAAEQFSPIGAGIMLGINAMLIYQNIGLAQSLRSKGHQLEAAHITNSNLSPINSMPLNTFADELGADSITIHRADLIQILYKNLDPKKIFTGKKAQYLVQNKNNAEVYFRDGDYAVGELVVGADGIHSVLRQQLFPDIQKRYLGQTCWRGVVDFKLSRVFQNQLFEAWGPNGRFAFVALNDKQVYWFAVKTANAGQQDNPKTIKSELCENFKMHKGPCQQLIMQTSKILRNDIYDLKTPKTWHQGRVVLLGDAIHAASPNLGQGGAQAIEDAHMLTYYLAQEKEINLALKQYEKQRFPKARKITEQSKLFGQLAHLSHPFWQKVRNQLMRNIPSRMSHTPLKSIFEVAPQTLSKAS